jgi:hypothetical protein
MEHGSNILVHCVDCGASRVPPTAVTVRACLDNGVWSYRFACATCGLPTVGASLKITLVAAIDAGACFEVWRLPTGLDARPGGPPFTPADVLELQRLMVEPHWFDEVVHCLDRER